MAPPSDVINNRPLSYGGLKWPTGIISHLPFSKELNVVGCIKDGVLIT